MGAGASRLPQETADEEQKEMVPTGASVSNASGRTQRRGERTFSHVQGSNTSAIQQTHPSQLPLRAPAPGSLRVTAVTWVPSGNTPQVPSGSHCQGAGF